MNLPMSSKTVSITKIQKGGTKEIKKIVDFATIRCGDEEIGMILSPAISKYLQEEGILQQVCEEIYELAQPEIVEDVLKSRNQEYDEDTVVFKVSDWV
jgi:hypothetical protein